MEIYIDNITLTFIAFVLIVYGVSIGMKLLNRKLIILSILTSLAIISDILYSYSILNSAMGDFFIQPTEVASSAFINSLSFSAILLFAGSVIFVFIRNKKNVRQIHTANE